MSNPILSYPITGDGTDTPTRIEIEHALSVLGAEQVAPGTWVATLSIGVKIRIRDPRPVTSPPALTVSHDRGYPEAWVVVCGMGGYVCAEPVADRPDGICGMPTESEPCSVHHPLVVSDAD